MSDLTTDITIDGTDYTITIDDTDRTINIHDHNGTITHTGYMHYNEEFDIYLIISYRTGMGKLLGHTVHQIGTKPTIQKIPREAFDEDAIRAQIEDELNYTLNDDQLDELADAYRETGAEQVHNWGLYDDELYRSIDTSGYLSTNTEAPLEGWGYIISNVFDDLDYDRDDERKITQTIFNALITHTPGEHDYPAKLELGPIEAWQVRAFELYQNSVLRNKPQLCRVQALREHDHRNHEISDILGTHRSTISHQIKTIDTWRERANWTTENVSD